MTRRVNWLMNEYIAIYGDDLANHKIESGRRVFGVKKKNLKIMIPTRFLFYFFKQERNKYRRHSIDAKHLSDEHA